MGGLIRPKWAVHAIFRQLTSLRLIIENTAIDLYFTLRKSQL